MPDIEGDDGAARVYYVRFLPLYTMETRRVNCARNRNCAISRLRTCATRSRDCAMVTRNLEIGTKFRDSENIMNARAAQSRDYANS